MQSDFGRCLGYSNTPCPNCGRVRLENYENGKQVCEKCQWCPQDEEYVDVFAVQNRIEENDYFLFCRKAEWWINEDGGLLCSKCGYFFDDAFGESLPDTCPKCKAEMNGVNEESEVDRNGRLLFNGRYAEEKYVPSWLKGENYDEGK